MRFRDLMAAVVFLMRAANRLWGGGVVARLGFFFSIYVSLFLHYVIIM